MSGMKKILFVIEDLKPGGVEVSLVNLLNLLDFETHKFKVTVIMWGNHYENIGLDTNKMYIDKIRNKSKYG